MVEYRIDTECPHCKETGILDHNPVGTDGVHYAWINCRICKRLWREEDPDWKELIKHKISMRR